MDTPANSIAPALLDRLQAAKYLCISVNHLGNLTGAGEMTSLTIGRRRLYRRVDLDAWVAERVVGGDRRPAAS
jgi:excisionase family DNA binding protein